MPTTPRHDPAEPSKSSKPSPKQQDKSVDETSIDDPDGKGYVGVTPDDLAEDDKT